jgi:hypothetical protein
MAQPQTEMSGANVRIETQKVDVSLYNIMIVRRGVLFHNTCNVYSIIRGRVICSNDRIELNVHI